MGNKVAVLAALVVLGILSWIVIPNVWEADNKLKSVVAKDSQVVATAENNSPIGAITRAKMLSERKSFRGEANQLFGLNLWPGQQEAYLQFKERILANGQLNSALQNAKKENVVVFLENEFEIGAGYVKINADATNEEVVDFLSNSVVMAKAKLVELESLNDEASQYGLYIRGYRQIEDYKKMRDRLLSSEEFASAFRTAAHEDIMIFLDNRFSVGRGYVAINVSATDEEIIKFLLGK